MSCVVGEVKSEQVACPLTGLSLLSLALLYLPEP